jgi:hypothetical protein
MASEMEKNAPWYQTTTLRMRVTVISSSTTAAATSEIAA